LAPPPQVTASAAGLLISAEVHKRNNQSIGASCIDICRSSSAVNHHAAQETSEDFIDLSIYNTSTQLKASVQDDSAMEFICPDHIKDMMTIVQSLRDQRKQILSEFRFNDPTRSVSEILSIDEDYDFFA
jgi:hypothetical protein